MKVEFFHDVICSFCFPMSYRMRQIQKKYPNLEVVHKSFALAPDASAFELMFESREQAKDEVISHWEAANQNDDLHRFNIEGMKKTDFLFPTSMPSLRAIKAVEILEGHDLSWDAFDAMQEAFFVNNRNVEDEEVIYDVIKSTGINMDEWQKMYEDDRTLKEVQNDMALAQSYGISGVPFVVINGKYGISGAQPLSHIESVFEKVFEEEGIQPLQMVNPDDEGGACSLGDDGQWNCD